MAQEPEQIHHAAQGSAWSRVAWDRRWQRAALAATLVVATALPLVPAAPPALAQAAGCAIPARQAVVAPPVTPAPIVIAPVRRGVATPVPAGSAAARPAASPMAVDPMAALTTELTGAAEALAACLTAGDGELVTRLATGRYLGHLYGDPSPLSAEDYLALTAGVAPVPVTIRALSDVRQEGETGASAEVISVVGNQLLRSRWSFVLAPEDERDEDESRWQVDAESPLAPAPPADAASIAVTLADYSFTLDATSVSGAAVVLNGRNESEQDHEMLVLRLDAGQTTTDLLRGVGPGLPPGITYIGQATVPAGESAELVLVDLAPGDYTLVCFFLTADGIPHLALGMEAGFTVSD